MVQCSARAPGTTHSGCMSLSLSLSAHVPRWCSALHGLLGVHTQGVSLSLCLLSLCVFVSVCACPQMARCFAWAPGTTHSGCVCLSLSLSVSSISVCICLRMSPDGAALCMGSWDYTLRVHHSLSVSCLCVYLSLSAHVPRWRSTLHGLLGLHTQGACLSLSLSLSAHVPRWCPPYRADPGTRLIPHWVHAPLHWANMSSHVTVSHDDVMVRDVTVGARTRLMLTKRTCLYPLLCLSVSV